MMKRMTFTMMKRMTVALPRSDIQEIKDVVHLFQEDGGTGCSWSHVTERQMFEFQHKLNGNKLGQPNSPADYKQIRMY